MSQSLLVLSNSGGNTANGTGAGVTKAQFREVYTFTKASTHTAQTLVPLCTINRAGTVTNISGSWLEVNAANTTLATFQVLKRASGAAAAGTALLSTAGTLTNNQTAQNVQSVGTAFTLSQNTGAAAVAPILSTTAATVAVAAGDQLVVTTTASSTQGTDLSISCEITYNLGDDTASSGLI